MIITAGNQARILSSLSEGMEAYLLQYLRQNPDDIFQLPHITGAVTCARIDQIKETDWRFHEPEANGPVLKHAVEHNLKGLKAHVALMRPSFLVSPLRSITQVSSDMKSKKVLTVGPRTEAEIYALVACGFDPANIVGLDLISYSDFVQTGDMHDMPFADETFDVVVLGWVLAYSYSPEVAAKEVLRVAKKDAVIAVGCEYTPLTAEELEAEGSMVADGVKFKTTDQILALFGDEVGYVYFRHDISPTRRDRAGGLMTIFERGEPWDVAD